MSPRLRLDQPAEYDIQVLGRLDERWANHFDGFTVSFQTAPGETVTTLHGIVADQSALHGMLNHIRDLGLPLLKVECLSTLETFSR